MKDFWQELWDFASKDPLIFPVSLIKEIHNTGRMIIKNHPEPVIYSCLTSCCLKVSKKVKLPDSLHNRMILGQNNKFVQEYVDGFGGKVK